MEKALTTFGFSNDDVDDIIQLACTALAWTEAGATEHDLALLHEAHASTWFSV